MRRTTSLTSRHAIPTKGLTAILAERVMGWSVGPDRFLMGGRRWLPRWRFQPLVSLEDAFRLLDSAGSTYTLTTDEKRAFTAEVQVGDRTGKASGEPKARAVTIALARALGLEVDR